MRQARDRGRAVVRPILTYCFRVQLDEARVVAEALSSLEPAPGWTKYALADRVADAVDNLNPTRIWFEPYFPHGQFTFSGPFG